MKAWTVTVAAGCAALALLALPPSPPSRQRGEELELTPERRRMNAARAELMGADQALRRRRWTDSLAALTSGAADREAAFVVGAPSDLPGRPDRAEGLATLAERVRAEIASLGIARPAVDLGVFLVDARHGSETARLVGGTLNRFEWYAGTAVGRPYCLSVRTSPTPNVRSLLVGRWQPRGVGRRTSILGPCALYARYGMPGAEIQRWMLGPGGSFATEWADVPLPPDPSEQRPLWLFSRLSSIRPSDLPLEGCLAGRDEACAMLVLEESNPNPGFDGLERYEPEIRRAGVPLLDGRPAAVGTPDVTSFASERMLDALHRRFGDEAFAAFWQSDRSFPEAFNAAFGTTPSEWGREWAQTVRGASARAVTPAVLEWALGLLYLTLALLAAAWIMRARQVG